MEEKRSVRIKCPQCEKRFNMELYEMLDATKDKSLTDKVLSGDLFVAECPECGTKFVIDYSVIYKADKYMIYCTGDGSDMNEALKVLAAADAKGMRRRVVKGAKQLREKLFIFAAELDDRVIELLKPTYLAYYNEDIAEDDTEVRDILFYVDEDGNPAFQIVGEDCILDSVEIDKDIYDIYEVKVHDSSVFSDNVFIVDNFWAKQCLAAYADEE